jgi:hypothetical protein
MNNIHQGRTITELSPISVTEAPDGYAPGTVHASATLIVWVPAATTSVVTPDIWPTMPVRENTALFRIGRSSTMRN